VKALDDHLDAVVRTGVPGAVATAAGPGFRWERAAGLADLETNESLKPDHRFRIGSVMKVFVATVVLQLVEEGALALDGDAGPIAEGVTIRQLLNHTSGFPNFHDDFLSLLEPYRKNRNQRWWLTPREQLAMAKERPRLFPPGTGWSYTGTNYLMLGLIVEETTGATLRQELRRRIVQPLGLEATDLPERVSSVSGLARGYLPADNPLLPGPSSVDVTDLDLPFNWAGGLARIRRLRARDRRDHVPDGQVRVVMRACLGPPRILRRVYDDRLGERRRRPSRRDHDQYRLRIRRDVAGSRRLAWAAYCS
jgi:D-alanyl-D-alanine carboxypeptidase